MYRKDIIDKYPLDKGLEDIIDNINDTCGEGEQFELIIRLLRVLMSWQIVCFNNENEKESYNSKTFPYLHFIIIIKSS